MREQRSRTTLLALALLGAAGASSSGGPMPSRGSSWGGSVADVSSVPQIVPSVGAEGAALPSGFGPLIRDRTSTPRMGGLSDPQTPHRIPIAEEFQGTRFVVIQNGTRIATPLLLLLLMVETTDVFFAIDSIPAIFAVTDQPFIVYTSNIFALLGLRALYFALASLLERFRYLKASLVFLLAYVGVKMLLAHSYPIPAAVSLAMVGGILSVGVIASLIGAGRDTAALTPPFSGAQLARTTVENAWKGVVLILGGTILAIGAAMIVLPGPALIVIPAGLAILGTQFVWARRLLDRARREMQHGVGRVRDDLRALRRRTRDRR